MTEDDYLYCSNTAANARRFLATALSLNRLFSGTGYTKDEFASNGLGSREYFAANFLLNTLPTTQIIPIDIAVALREWRRS
mmetsp:Transcript_81196/g.140964  ORF Transcript_81196/g.140964 Transcript_81196/m.140964 type:complete len:81 (+) Transcript_81196:1-243(+)